MQSWVQDAGMQSWVEEGASAECAQYEELRSQRVEEGASAEYAQY